MTKITLEGAVGVAVGRTEWSLHISSVREALRAIEAQTQKLFQHFKKTSDEGIEYRVVINGKDHQGIEDLQCPTEKLETIEIIPVPSGSDGGLWQTIIGVVLIIVAVVLVFFDGGSFSSSIASYGWLLMAGISLTLGGISQMMSKSPSFSAHPNIARSFGKQRQSEESGSAKAVPNYIFNGAANTTRQGTIVPIGYGRVIVGSQLVSFGITKTRINFSLGGPIEPPDDDPFFALPFWDTFALDYRAQYVQTDQQISRYNKADTLEAADLMDLRDTTTGAKAAVSVLKLRLRWLSRLFVHHEQLTIKQARGLYDWLELTTLSAIPLRNRRFQDYVGALAFHYLGVVI